MSSHLSLKIRLGPLVSLEVGGNNCHEILEALKGFDDLNKQLDAMCSDLAERVYPEGEECVQNGHDDWTAGQDNQQERE